MTKKELSMLEEWFLYILGLKITIAVAGVFFLYGPFLDTPFWKFLGLAVGLVGLVLASMSGYSITTYDKGTNKKAAEPNKKSK